MKKTLIVLLLLVSCIGKNDNEEPHKNLDNEVFNEIIYDLIDSLTSQYNLQNKIIVHHEIYPDNVKINTIVLALKEVGNVKSDKVDLLKKLKGIISDSIKLNIAEKKGADYTFIISEAEVNKILNNHDKNYFGFVNLSKIAFNEGEDLGCFYFAIQCGSNCGYGYFVFVKKTEMGKWEIVNLLPAWN